MFKIILNKTWNKHGVQTNYTKYLNVNNRNRVFDFYKKEEIKNILEL
jgi:hypothetical protein